jgi:hypothetical protein
MIPLIGVKVRARIFDEISMEVEMTQVYLNKSTDPIEATYSISNFHPKFTEFSSEFPIEDESAVTGFEARIGEKVIKG